MQVKCSVIKHDLHQDIWYIHTKKMVTMSFTPLNLVAVSVSLEKNVSDSQR
jgi:hypothetical protein